jgi:hypothetical protein
LRDPDKKIIINYLFETVKNLADESNAVNSASIIIEDNSKGTKTKILCDPWLDGEEYIGSWGMYPQYEFKPENFADLGAHLKYDRVGSVYKIGLFYCWNHFHV